MYHVVKVLAWFQHTAARRRLLPVQFVLAITNLVSTHSRAEAAAKLNPRTTYSSVVSTHSRAEAAAHKIVFEGELITVSTHSRAEAAAERTKRF